MLYDGIKVQEDGGTAAVQVIRVESETASPSQAMAENPNQHTSPFTVQKPSTLPELVVTPEYNEHNDGVKHFPKLYFTPDLAGQDTASTSPCFAITPVSEISKQRPAYAYNDVHTAVTDAVSCKHYVSKKGAACPVHTTGTKVGQPRALPHNLDPAALASHQLREASKLYQLCCVRNAIRNVRLTKTEMCITDAAGNITASLSKPDMRRIRHLLATPTLQQLDLLSAHADPGVDLQRTCMHAAASAGFVELGRTLLDFWLNTASRKCLPRLCRLHEGIISAAKHHHLIRDDLAVRTLLKEVGLPVKHAFELLDLDGDGDIQWEELVAVTGNNRVVTAVDAEGNTPLHDAAEGGYLDFCAMLIKAGADVDAQNHAGETPLHCAISSKHQEVAAMLVTEGGANVMLCSYIELPASLHSSRRLVGMLVETAEEDPYFRFHKSRGIEWYEAHRRGVVHIRPESIFEHAADSLAGVMATPPWYDMGDSKDWKGTPVAEGREDDLEAGMQHTPMQLIRGTAPVGKPNRGWFGCCSRSKRAKIHKELTPHATPSTYEQRMEAAAADNSDSNASPAASEDSDDLCVCSSPFGDRHSKAGAGQSYPIADIRNWMEELGGDEEPVFFWERPLPSAGKKGGSIPPGLPDGASDGRANCGATVGVKSVTGSGQRPLLVFDRSDSSVNLQEWREKCSEGRALHLLIEHMPEVAALAVDVFRQPMHRCTAIRSTRWFEQTWNQRQYNRMCEAEGGMTDLKNYKQMNSGLGEPNTLRKMDSRRKEKSTLPHCASWVLMFVWSVASAPFRYTANIAGAACRACTEGAYRNEAGAGRMNALLHDEGLGNAVRDPKGIMYKYNFHSVECPDGMSPTLDKIIECECKELLAHKWVEQLLDHKWQKFASTRFNRGLFIYILYFLCFVFDSVLQNGDNWLYGGYFGSSRYGSAAASSSNDSLHGSSYFLSMVGMSNEHGFERLRRVFGGLLFILNSHYTWREQRNVKELGGVGAYLRDGWNLITLSQLLSVWAIFGCRAFGPFRISGGFTWEQILQALCAPQMWVKFLHFARANRVFGPYVRVICKMFRDILTFSVVFILFLLGFAHSLYIMKVGGYNRGLFSASMATFQVGMGEWDYDAIKASGPVAQVLFLGYSWVGTIMLLNMLIAIMGGTYEAIKSSQYEYWQLERAKLIVAMQKGLPDSLYRSRHYTPVLYSLEGDEPIQGIKTCRYRPHQTAIKICR
jgi:hypothetical protein